MIVGVCWRCEQPGHIATECTPPPAVDRKQLHARIDRYVERWQQFEITAAQKQQWITAELKAFNPPKKRKAA